VINLIQINYQQRMGIGKAKPDSGVYQNEDSSYGWYWNREEPRLKTGAECMKPFASVRIAAARGRNRIRYFPIKAGDIQSLKFDIT
jgi:hypothetical protein